MASGAHKGKRKTSTEGGVSPPPLKRKVQSLTTQSAVASFFTPLSQKAPERTLWQERGHNEQSPNTLLVGQYEPENTDAYQLISDAVQQRRKIAAFDLDSTLIQTASGKKHASEAQDWRWWHACVPGVLKKLCMEGFHILVISNQAGIALKDDTKAPKVLHRRLAAFKTKINAVFSQLDLPISIYVATEKDIYRKPRTGMWTEMLENRDLNNPNMINLSDSFFVGDAGGRLPLSGLAKDFSSSDRDFAENVGIKFHTPEEFFLNEAPRPFRRTFEPSRYTREEGDPSDIGIPGHIGDDQQLTPASVLEKFHKKNIKDMVLFCGSPAAGKSTFYWRHLQPLQYERINQDILKTRERCLKVADAFLSEGKSVAVDNTNADKEVRCKWVELATKHQVPIRCVLFSAGPELCDHNNTVRGLNHAMNPENRGLLPKLAFSGFLSRYQRPQLSEGFQDIMVIEFKFQGTKAERDIWAQYWS